MVFNATFNNISVNLYYLCLLEYSGVQHALCCVLLFCLSSSCVLCVIYCYFLWIVHSSLFLLWQSRMNNTETLATLDTQDTGQINIGES
jgi:hypothetical protein